VGYKLVLQVSDCLFKLFFVLNKLSSRVERILKGLDFIVLVTDSVPLLGNFGLESLFVFKQSSNELGQASVKRVEVFELLVHFVSLGFHFCDLLFSGGDVLFEFLYFMVQHVLELL
jgi:hypothetical protein